MPRKVVKSTRKAGAKKSGAKKSSSGTIKHRVTTAIVRAPGGVLVGLAGS